MIDPTVKKYLQRLIGFLILLALFIAVLAPFEHPNYGPLK